jgi:hypothetical protein
VYQRQIPQTDYSGEKLRGEVIDASTGEPLPFAKITFPSNPNVGAVTDFDGKFEIKGKTTYKEEFVTAGGIDLSVLNTTNFECQEIKNLFFIGEILNIDGITGGFNFQNAWTSSWVVAQEINHRIKA